MKLNYLLIGGFLIVALLVGFVGYVGLNTATTLKQQEAILLAAKDIQVNILGALETTQEYLQAEDLDKLTELDTKHHDYEEQAEMWIEALGHGTDSDKFKSEGFYQKYWVQVGYESQGRSVIFDPEIAELAEELEDIFKEFDEIEEAVRDSHDEKILLQQTFDQNYDLEKTGRYNIRTPLFAIDNRQITEDVGFLQYYSKEALYQYRDQKHVDEWLGSIRKIKNKVPTLDLPQSEKSQLSNELATYEQTAQTMGQIAIKARDIEEQNSAKLLELDQKVEEMEQKILSLVGKVINKAEQIRSRTTTILQTSTFVALLLSVILDLFISSSISKPLKKLTDTVEEVSKGRLDVQIEKSNIYEINKLAEALDRVMTTMKRAIKRVKPSRRTYDDEGGEGDEFDDMRSKFEQFQEWQQEMKKMGKKK